MAPATNSLFSSGSGDVPDDRTHEPDTILTKQPDGELAESPIAKYPPEFQTLVSMMRRHGFIPVVEDCGAAGVRLWAQERSNKRPVEMTNPIEAAKALCRELRVAEYATTWPTVEPDSELEQRLKEAGLDHDLDHPMQPDRIAARDAQQALYDDELEYKPEIDLDRGYERGDD